MAAASQVREYYRLAKPGIVYGNAMTAAAAFLYASGWNAVALGGWGSAFMLFLASLVGISLVIASGCVFNNWLDRDIDRRMERTRTRPLVTGIISVRAALVFGTALGLCGLTFLLLFTNILTAGIALFGWFSYIFLYGWAKRRGWWGAIVGSVPGAVPIVVGYAAVTDRLDLPALLLFFTMVAWQMPHFYAIAMFREKEYAAAGIPTLVGTRGIRAAKTQSLFFMFAFLVIAPLLSLLGYAGYTYGIVMLVLGAAWVWRAARSMHDEEWGRRIFSFSLLLLVGFSLALGASSLLP